MPTVETKRMAQDEVMGGTVLTQWAGDEPVPLAELGDGAEEELRYMVRGMVETMGAVLGTLAATCVRFEQYSDFLNDSCIQDPWHEAFARGEGYALSTAAMAMGHMHNWILLRAPRPEGESEALKYRCVHGVQITKPCPECNRTEAIDAG